MEQVKFKDVAHLYLGCDLQTRFNDGSGGVFQLNTWYVEGIRTDFLHRDIKPTEIKPILRPLSSITDQEKRKVLELNDSEGSVNAMPFRINRTVDFYFKRTNFKVVAWLLKQHFDLFGLIESSQALDKTLFPQPNEK